MGVKTTLIVFSVLVMAAIFAVVTRPEPFPLAGHIERKAVSTVASMFGRCPLPIAYEVGTIDPRFGMDAGELESALRDAEALWERGTGVDIFVNGNGGAVGINLVYDERQATADRLAAELEDIGSKTDRYDAARDAYDAAAADLEARRAKYDAALRDWDADRTRYESDVAEYEERLSDYLDDVTFWNAIGGAPQDEYEKLEDEREELDEIADELSDRRVDIADRRNGLEDERIALNALVDRVNAVADVANGFSQDIMAKVDRYNSSRSDEPFITGLYTESGFFRSIDVFQFTDRDELVLILAHEFGHAIGLGHASDEGSVMYERITPGAGGISGEDRELYRELCEPAGAGADAAI